MFEIEVTENAVGHAINLAKNKRQHGVKPVMTQIQHLFTLVQMLFTSSPGVLARQPDATYLHVLIAEPFNWQRCSPETINSSIRSSRGSMRFSSWGQQVCEDLTGST